MESQSNFLDQFGGRNSLNCLDRLIWLNYILESTIKRKTPKFSSKIFRSIQCFFLCKTLNLFWQIDSIQI